MKVVEIGKTAEAVRQLMAIITPRRPQAARSLQGEFSRRLGTPEGSNRRQAQRAREGGKRGRWSRRTARDRSLGAHQLIPDGLSASTAGSQTTRF